jgi:hypothetical protein
MFNRSRDLKIQRHSVQSKSATRYFSLLLAMGLPILAGSNLPVPLNFLEAQPAFAQRVKPEEAWKEVYQQLPNLPQENQYISKETRKVATDNTLVGRLIRYHVYVKGRPSIFRFDWKLTLADYLERNELMQESVYPGADTLQQNPLEGDKAAIRRLTLAQRDALVQSLVNIFNPRAAAASQSPTQPSSPSPQPTVNPSLPNQPQPGAADLLKP